MTCIFTENVTLSKAFFTHFASKNQPLGFSVMGTLIGNRLMPLELTAAAAAATDTAIHKKIFGSGNTTLITSIEEMNDIMKMMKPLEGSALLIKEFIETIKNEAKEQKRRIS